MGNEHFAKVPLKLKQELGRSGLDWRVFVNFWGLGTLACWRHQNKMASQCWTYPSHRWWETFGSSKMPGTWRSSILEAWHGWASWGGKCRADQLILNYFMIFYDYIHIESLGTAQIRSDLYSWLGFKLPGWGFKLPTWEVILSDLNWHHRIPQGESFFFLPRHQGHWKHRRHRELEPSSSGGPLGHLGHGTTHQTLAWLLSTLADLETVGPRLKRHTGIHRPCEFRNWRWNWEKKWLSRKLPLITSLSDLSLYNDLQCPIDIHWWDCHCRNLITPAKPRVVAFNLFPMVMTSSISWTFSSWRILTLPCCQPSQPSRSWVLIWKFKNTYSKRTER